MQSISCRTFDFVIRAFVVRRQDIVKTSRFYSTGVRFSATMTAVNSSSAIIRRVDNVIKSAEDKRSYRGLELSNQMKVMLVSDPTTDKSAASMDVNVGYLSDPDHIPGLAHFCEHMLFLGTEKYPKENDYSKFLSEHGGCSNAATYPDHTTYYFDIVPDHLKNVLDRFAQFFLHPRFTESATERELNAVNSEHDKNISSDMWRLDQLDKHTSDPKHPYYKFGTGNKQTLDTIPKQEGYNVRDELLKFHETWYSSNIMALAVLGKESLDELEEMIVSLFSEVQNKNVTAPSWPEHPFGEEQKRICAYVVPIKDVRNLNIMFPTPDLHEYYKSSPCSYISHLVGHEGAGSLLSALKAKGWSSSLVGGNRSAPRGFGFFGISMDLTEEGMNHIDDIITLVFQCFNMLRKMGPQKWIYEEHRDICNMHFRFKDKESPSQYISTVVQSIHDYPLEEVLSGPYILSEYRPDIVEQLLEDFNPDNMRLAVIAKKYAGQTDQIEPWYGTEFKVEKISENKLANWKNAGFCDELKLPERNEFIPTNFDILPLDKDITQHPSIIQDTALFRVWFKQDDEFLLPKTNITFDFVSPLAYLDPMNCNLTHMFVQLFRDSLNEYAYAAEIAGMRWELTNTKYGLILGVGGYSSKQHVLLDKIMDKLTNFKIDPKRFEILKENYVRTLKNFAAEQPYQHAVYYLAVLLTEHSWTKQELLEATEQLTLERLEGFIPLMLSKMHIESLVHGNANKEKALELMNIVESRLTSTFSMQPLLPRQLLLNRELKLDNGCNYLYEVENNVHRSSCVELYYQCGVQCKESNMLLELFTQIIHEPCFDILRTKEQLGYIVFSGIRRSNGVQGLRVIVQSDKHPRHVDQRVEEFLRKMYEYVVAMSDEEFTRHKDALAARRLEKPKRLGGLTSQFWAEITSQQYHFDRANIEVGYLHTINKEDIVNFYKDLLADQAQSRHKLAVHVLSTANGGATFTKLDNNKQDGGDEDEMVAAQVISDVTVFKSCHGMYPLAQPYINIIRKGNRCKL
ncbi:Insulin degrading metalloproteinase [Carabus blaptoides fortunei]